MGDCWALGTLHVLPDDLTFPKEHGTSVLSLLLSLEALHIFTLLIVGNSSALLTFLPLGLQDLDWIVWIITGAISGIINYLLFRGRSTMASGISLVAVTGAIMLALSSLVKPLPAEEVMRRLGAALMSGAVVAAVWFQLQNRPKLFPFSTRHMALIFLTPFLSILIVVQMSMLGRMLILVRSTGNPIFNFIQGTWIRLYPYTIALFTLLVTQPLWLPILVKIDTVSIRIDSDSTRTRESASKRGKPFQYWPFATLAIAVGIIVSSYRLQAVSSLTGDAHYYFSVLQQIDILGMQSILSTDRPFLFLILGSIKTCFSMETEQLLKYLQIFLTSALVVSTHIFISSSFKDEMLAALSAFLAAISPHVTIGINYFIVGNWFALVMMMLFFTSVLRSFETKSRAWGFSSLVLSCFMLGIHFPTWAFSVLTLFAYALICCLRRDLPHRMGMSYFLRVASTCLLIPLPIALVSLGTPEIFTSVREAMSKTIAILVRITPLNIVEFLEDNVLLSSYFGCGSYSIPFAYALALLGSYRLYNMREPAARLILSWAMVSSLGVLLIPKFEHWRLLYMMPLEILVASGFLYSLMSAKLLEGSLDSRRTISVAGATLTGGLLLGVAMPFVASLLIFMAIVLAILGCFLACSMNRDEVCQSVAIEIVCLCVLLNIALALCSLR